MTAIENQCFTKPEPMNQFSALLTPLFIKNTFLKNSEIFSQKIDSSIPNLVTY